MATDKLSDHVGNHGGRYTDINGHSKQFTYVDHDIKTTISARITEEDKVKLAAQLKQDRIDSVKKLLGLPASLVPEEFRVYTTVEDGKIVWNKTMLEDPGMDPLHIYNMSTIINNKIELGGY